MSAAAFVRPPRGQRGATLLISLIMLVVLTLFAITAIRTGNVGLKIVGNQQAQKLMEAAAQQAIEQVVSNLGNFDAANVPTVAIAQRICVNGQPPVIVTNPSTTACTSGIPVDVQPVRCIATRRSQFDSLTQPQATFDNTWEIVATVTDALTGARATYHQGIKIRMLSNSCPGLST